MLLFALSCTEIVSPLCRKGRKLEKAETRKGRNSKRSKTIESRLEEERQSAVVGNVTGLTNVVDSLLWW